jgi:hypothetical protein
MLEWALLRVGTSLYFFDALIFAHLARCAAAILFLPAADILRRARVVFAPRSSRCRTSVNFSISFRISCAMDSRLMAAPSVRQMRPERIACSSDLRTREFDVINIEQTIFSSEPTLFINIFDLGLERGPSSSGSFAPWNVFPSFFVPLEIRILCRKTLSGGKS